MTVADDEKRSRRVTVSRVIFNRSIFLFMSSGEVSGSGNAAGKQKAVECICTDEQKKGSAILKCAFCCERAGVIGE